MSSKRDDVGLADDFRICRAEAWLMMKIWLLQSVVMVGIFLALGYYRTDDPLGFPFGLPSWYLFGGVIPSLIFLAIVIYVAVFRLKEVPVK